jgi:MFS family permease
VGAVCGAVFFGWLTDRFGRRKLFFITLLLYVAATAATALSWNLCSFIVFRLLTGAGIGGEYTAVNSTIQEFTPSRSRGWANLCINGSFWLGAALGAAGSVVMLDPHLLPQNWGWRVCFFIGAALGLTILLLRLWVPESPRWLLTHGREPEARKIVEGIEDGLRRRGKEAPSENIDTMRLHARTSTSLAEVFHTLFHSHRRQSLEGLTLMAAQAFFYNAIFFTYALVLTDFYQIPGDHVGWYVLPLAMGSFVGPVVLGKLFDVVGRRIMISLTYGTSGLLLTIFGYLFYEHILTATTQTIAWGVLFFFASSAASSAYLTVSETFPLEVRALAIAVSYAFGTTLGGVVGPVLFGRLIDSHQEVSSTRVISWAPR